MKDAHAVAADVRAALGDLRRAMQRLEHASLLAEGRTGECLAGAGLHLSRTIALLNAARDELAAGALFAVPAPELVRRAQRRRGSA